MTEVPRTAWRDAKIRAAGSRRSRARASLNFEGLSFVVQWCVLLQSSNNLVMILASEIAFRRSKGHEIYFKSLDAQLSLMTYLPRDAVPTTTTAA